MIYGSVCSRIEAVARAMCWLDGRDPDQINAWTRQPNWMAFGSQAIRHITTYDLLRKLEKEIGDAK